MSSLNKIMVLKDLMRTQLQPLLTFEDRQNLRQTSKLCKATIQHVPMQIQHPKIFDIHSVPDPDDWWRIDEPCSSVWIDPINKTVYWQAEFHPIIGGSITKQYKVHNIKTVISSCKAFAAIREDGTVIGCGSPEFGGDLGEVKDQLYDIKSISSTAKAFAALREDGKVITWGDEKYGANSSNVQDQLYNIKSITSNFSAFAAIREDGVVIAWGGKYYGGDTGQVQNQLYNIKSISATEAAFAVLREDGKVIVWGGKYYGGNAEEKAKELYDIKILCSTCGAFAALREDGVVIVWGLRYDGGYLTQEEQNKINEMNIDYIAKIPNKQGFMAVPVDGGNPIFWGES